MINIGCYDLTGKIREEFKKVPCINESSNIKFFPENNDRIYDLFSREAIDIMFVDDDEKHLSAYDFVCYLKENHPEIQIIFVSDKIKNAFVFFRKNFSSTIINEMVIISKRESLILVPNNPLVKIRFLVFFCIEVKPCDNLDKPLKTLRIRNLQRRNACFEFLAVHKS